MIKRMKQGIVVLSAVVAMMIGAASGALAASGQVGPHDNPEASCNNTVSPSLQVHTPFIQASTVSHPANVVIVGPNHVQWVGFRSWLLRWNGFNWNYTDQNGDGKADFGPLMQAQVASSEGNSWLPPSQWWNADQKRWESGTTFFSIKYKGYYRVRMEYFWYADQYAASGYDVLDSIHHYFTQGMSVLDQSWCQY